MGLFFLIFLHYIASMLAILVGISSAILFLVIQRFEQALKTFWRGIGFAALAIAFFMFILEQKYPAFALTAVIVQFIGFFSIFMGVLKEPGLAKLVHVRKLVIDPTQTIDKIRERKLGIISFLKIGAFIMLFLVIVELSLVITTTLQDSFPAGAYLPSLFELLSTVFIGITIFLQAKRYRLERDKPDSRTLNLLPLLGFVMLFFRGLFLISYRLPASNLVAIQNLQAAFSLPWRAAIFFTFVAFAFLGIWAWYFIKARLYLRTIVSFLAVAIIVSSLGSLIFTVLIFTIIQQNNFKLMTEGSSTEELVMEDRKNTALVIARSLADKQGITTQVTNDDYNTLVTGLRDTLLASSLDILRVYDSNGNVIASASDQRERGESHLDDVLVKTALTQRKSVTGFDTKDHVLAPLIAARAVYPLVSGGKAIGAIEVGYLFDSAFVDYSKARTGLDVTIYAGDLRSATSIYKEDGVSRFVGTHETQGDVVDRVIGHGETYALEVERLGINYYTAFLPLRDYNGKIIGMVSVGTPTYQLFEDSRQQLLSSFLILTFVSLLAAAIGYMSMRNIEKYASQ